MINRLNCSSIAFLRFHKSLYRPSTSISYHNNSIICFNLARPSLLSFSKWPSITRMHCEQRIVQQQSPSPLTDPKKILEKVDNSLAVNDEELDASIAGDSLTKDVSWSAVWKYLKQDWLLLIAVGITAIGTAIINITTPRVIGQLANILTVAMRGGGTTGGWTSILGQLKVPAITLLSLFAGQGFLTFIYISLVSILGENVAFRLRKDLFESLMKQDMAFFDSIRTGELINRLTNDVGEFKHSLKICVSSGIKSITQIVGSTFQLISISYALTGYLVAAGHVLYAIGNLYGSYLRKLSRKAKEMEGAASAIASESLSNIRTVRAFANEEFEMSHFTGALETSASAQKKLGFHIGIFQGFTNFSIGSMIAFVLFFGGRMVANETMSGGDLMSYLISVQNAQKSLASLSVLFAQTIKAFGAFARVQEYLDRPSTIAIRGGVIPDHLDGDIKFENVKFAYPSRPDILVFDDFNLEIPAGRIYALCGASGAGKSSVAALIERFYSVNDGKVTVDGINVNEICPNWLRKNIGYIHQEPILFSGSILDNIRYGNPDATMEEVHQAAISANAADFIESLPQKYDTVVGERGVTLSGGQRQRIAIARALLKNPKILIFDEATSALDAESERIVQEALSRLMQGRTVILIAHRLSTIQDADKILLLAKGGQILESGSHYELMYKRGHYYNLYTSVHPQSQ